MNRVAFVGQMHAGKTTAAKELMSRGYERVSFAGPVKDVAGKMLTVFVQTIDPHHKEIVVDDKLKGHPIIRKFLQFVGTELGREWTENPDTWVELARRELEPYNPLLNTVIDDCRYWNEYDMLRKQGFVFVRILRNEDDRIASIMGELERTMPTATVDERRDALYDILSHESERYAQEFPVEYEFTGRSVEHIQKYVQAFVGEIAFAAVR